MIDASYDSHRERGTKATPRPGDELVDSGDVISRLNELHAVLQLQEDAAEIVAWMDQYEAEYLSLQSVNSQASLYGSWGHGETLVRRDVWPQYYARMQSSAVSPRPVLVDWLATFKLPGGGETQVAVDWDASADVAAEDYAEVDFGGVAYLLVP